LHRKNGANERSAKKTSNESEKQLKRYGDIYDKIYDMNNLYEAHKNARKDKKFYKEVKMVDSDPEYYLGLIHDMLKNETYKVSEYSISIINDKGKERMLMKLPYFPDRIIQWAIMLQTEQIFIKTFCSHTCASIPRRGISKAVKYTERHMKDPENAKYCLKIDVSKFYPNIDHAVLKALLRKKFKDKRLLKLLDLIIDSYPGDKGVPIGSYLSQYLANFYLCYFDHWLKEVCREKRVTRYMDDVSIHSGSKEHLHELLCKIRAYLEKELKLQLKGNYQIFPVRKRGLDFVGYRHFFGFRLLRKKTAVRLKRKMMKMKSKMMLNYNEWCSVNSYIGLCCQCNSYRLCRKYIHPLLSKVLLYYKRVIAKNYNAYRRYKNKLFSKGVIFGEEYGNSSRLCCNGKACSGRH